MAIQNDTHALDRAKNNHHHSIDPICICMILKVKYSSVDIYTPKKHKYDTYIFKI